MPRAKAILPFVRLSYAQPSTYSWFNEGERKVVTQAEGGELGDPLLSLLFSIGIQGVLEQVARSLGPGEHLCAFLDDIYMFASRTVCDRCVTFLVALHREAGIRLHTGKTRVWNRGGIVPARVEELGPDVWSGDGMKVLEHFWVRFNSFHRWWRNGSQKNAGCGRPFRECLISSAWQLLVQSANPRSNHTIRTLPPLQSAEYARRHDEGMGHSARSLKEVLVQNKS